MSDNEEEFYMEDSPEEFAQQVAEWSEFVKEDFVGAIEAGYLDDVLGSISAAVLIRRASLGGSVKRQRTPNTVDDEPTAPRQMLSGIQVGAENHTPGKTLNAVGAEYDGYTHTHTHPDGTVYRKSDIQLAGQRFVLTKASAYKYKGAVVKVIKVNRSKAVCEVIGHERQGMMTPIYGMNINVPLNMVIDEIRLYNDTYGTRS